MGVDVGAAFYGREKVVRIELHVEEAEGLAEMLADNDNDRGFRELSDRIYAVLAIIRPRVASDAE